MTHPGDRVTMYDIPRCRRSVELMGTMNPHQRTIYFALYKCTHYYYYYEWYGRIRGTNSWWISAERIVETVLNQQLVVDTVARQIGLWRRQAMHGDTCRSANTARRLTNCQSSCSSVRVLHTWLQTHFVSVYLHDSVNRSSLCIS